jgi:uncharacterized protein
VRHRFLSPAVVIASFALCSTGLLAQTSHPPQVVTTATADRSLPPDQANLTVGIEVHAPTAAEASHQLRERLAQLHSWLKQFPAPLDSVQTVVFNISSNYDMRHTLVDYEGTADVRVSLRSLENLAPLVDTLFAAGATEIPYIAFTSDSTITVRRTLLAQAMAEARADALVLAAAAGNRLGSIIEVTTSLPNDPYSFVGRRGGQFVGGSAGLLEADGGLGFRSVQVQASVRATWALLPQVK